MMRFTVPLKGSHALVTGGARGIGRATVKRLLSAGTRVTIWDRDAAALREIGKELESEGYGTVGTGTDRPWFATAAIDITDRETLPVAVDHAAGRAPIDILINNAGVLFAGRFHERDFTVWRTTNAINVDALMHLTYLVLPGMYQRRRGHVVNISSAAATVAVPGLAVYSASKWAVWGFSEALRAEAREYQVAVSSIHPSYIARGLFAGARLNSIGSMIVPQLRDHDVVAEAIVERALRGGEHRPMRPRSVRLTLLLRGVLSDHAFQWVARKLGVWSSMSYWQGTESSRHNTERSNDGLHDE